MQVTALEARDDGEATLVARARAGDQDAFAQLLIPRADRHLRTARAILGNESEAHDAAQNAFVSAWVNLSRLRDVDRFDAWVNRILRNECRQALRRRRSSRVVEISTVAAEAATARGEADPASSVETAAVQAAFRRLSVDDRTILLLHHLHGLGLEEVARQLAIPIGTAKSRLWAARRALERALETER